MQTKPDQPTKEIELSIRPVRVAYLLVGLVLVLAVVGTVANLVIYHVAPHPEHKLARLMHRFDLGHEPSIPAWYSSVALLACAVLLCCIAAIKRRRRDRFTLHWFGLAILFLLLAVDEAVMFHEMLVNTLRERLDARGIFYMPWVIPGMLFVAAVGLTYLRFLWHLPSADRRRFLIAGAVFVGGAIGMEMISAAVIDAHTVASPWHTFTQTIEESMEMLGVVIFIHALLCYFDKQVGTIRLRTSSPKTTAST